MKLTFIMAFDNGCLVEGNTRNDLKKGGIDQPNPMELRFAFTEDGIPLIVNRNDIKQLRIDGEDGSNKKPFQLADVRVKK